MEDLYHPEERRRHQRYLVDLPLNFQLSEVSNIYPGLSINASETGLLIQTLKNMSIGIKLKIEVLFAKGFELSTIQGVTEIIWKDDYGWDSFSGYKYGLKFIQISNENYSKLKFLLGEQFNLKNLTSTLGIG